MIVRPLTPAAERAAATLVRPRAPVSPERAAATRAPQHRAARAAVLWGVAAFVLASAGLSAALETVLPQLRDPEYGYRLVRVREQHGLHPGRPLVLVMGTSRTANGFDPLAAGAGEPTSPLWFNFGLSGGGPPHVRSRLAALRADGVRPNAVVVELFFAALAADEAPDRLCAPTAPKLSAGEVRRLEPQLADPAALGRAWLHARLNPWQAQQQVVMNHVAPALLPRNRRIDHYWRHADRFGFDAYPTNGVDEQRPRRLAERRATYERLARRARVGPHADAAIRGLVADCRASGTPVAFFTTPESPEFQSWYTSESRARLDAYARGLTSELGCPVFAAPDDYAEADFADGHHMLPHAAARFSRNLTERHLKPWLASLPIGGKP